MSSSIEKIIEFQEVVIKGDGVKTHCLSFDAVSGDLVVIECAEKEYVQLTLDLAEGLTFPDSGSVFFAGCDWRLLDDVEANRLRGMVGRIFSGRSWISNLSIVENLALPLIFHLQTSAQNAYEIVSEKLGRFDLSYTLHKRPHEVNESDREILQWIRAFLGNKKLVLADLSKNLLLLLGQRKSIITGLVDEGLKNGKIILVALHDKSFNNVLDIFREKARFISY